MSPSPDAELAAFLDRVPQAHRAPMRAAVEQWQCAMWLAARRAGVGNQDAGADPISAGVLRVYAGVLETLAGEPVAGSIATPGAEAMAGPGAAADPDPDPDPDPDTDSDTGADARLALGGALGGVAGTLARIAAQASIAAARRDDPAQDPAPPARALYEAYVDEWERIYRDWMKSEEFARLQGELCNAALTLRLERAGR